MNRIVSFGGLLFSFALVMLSFQPEGKPVVFTIPEFPVEWYRGFGIAAIIMSLTFLITAAKKGWSEWAGNILDSRLLYGVSSIIYEGVYILSFLRGYIEVHKTSPPPWIDYTVFLFGIIVAAYIPMITLKFYPKKPTDKKTE